MQNVVGARSTLPILSNVLLIAGENKLELRATLGEDYEEAELEENGVPFQQPVNK